MRFKLDIRAKQVHSEIKIIDKYALNIQTVYRWFRLFKKGKNNLEDKKPTRVTTDDNISKIKAFIKSDPYCAYTKLAAIYIINKNIYIYI